MNQELGSLAQSARGNQLKTARWILIFVGVLTAGANCFFLINSESSINKQVVDLQQQGQIVDLDEVAGILSYNRILFGSLTALGVLFIVLGIMVYQFPVPCTVTGLVLYVGAAAVFGFLDPMTLASGLIIKILIVVGLIKSVKSAIAYSNDQQLA